MWYITYITYRYADRDGVLIDNMLVAILNAVQLEDQCHTLPQIFDAVLVGKNVPGHHMWSGKKNTNKNSCRVELFFFLLRNPRYEWSLGLLWWVQSNWAGSAECCGNPSGVHHAGLAGNRFWDIDSKMDTGIASKKAFWIVNLSCDIGSPACSWGTESTA